MTVATLSLTDFLDRLSVGRPQQCHNLFFVPLVLSQESLEHPGTYTPITEALSARQTAVRETGSVPSLLVENQGDKPVFAPAGMYLRGGGQDRMLAVSIVIEAHTSGEIPVRCVERNRWNPRKGQPLETPETGVFAASTAIEGTVHTLQEGVWDTVADFAEATRVSSDSSDSSRHGDTYEQSAETLEEFGRALTLDGVEGRVVGAAFCVQYSHPSVGTHWAIDVFGRTDLLRAYFEGLRDSAALTAIAVDANGPLMERALDEVSVDAYDVLRNVAREAPLTPEVVPANRGTLKTGQSSAGARIAILEDLGQPLHVLLRWTVR